MGGGVPNLQSECARDFANYPVNVVLGEDEPLHGRFNMVTYCPNSLSVRMLIPVLVSMVGRPHHASGNNMLPQIDGPLSALTLAPVCCDSDHNHGWGQ